MTTTTAKTDEMSATKDTAIRNGIDLDALQCAISGIMADPAQGETTWSVLSQWKGGTRSDHHVSGLTIGGQRVERPFTIKIDEPFELTGSNQYPNPQEYLLSALNACMMVGYAAVAALMGINLTRLEVETTGDIDLRGFLGIDASVAPGYVNLNQVVRIDGDGDAAQFEELHKAVRATSPNYYNITRAIEVDSRMVVG